MRTSTWRWKSNIRAWPVNGRGSRILRSLKKRLMASCPWSGSAEDELWGEGERGVPALGDDPSELLRAAAEATAAGGGWGTGGAVGGQRARASTRDRNAQAAWDVLPGVES